MRCEIMCTSPNPVCLVSIYEETLRTQIRTVGSVVVKNSPANAGDAGSIPAQEDPLKKEMAIHSSILAWEIPWTEKPGGLQSLRSQNNRA